MDWYSSLNIISYGSRNACRLPSLYSETCYKILNNLHINAEFCESVQPTRSRDTTSTVVAYKRLLGQF